MPEKKVLFCRSNPIAPDPRVEKEARALTRSGYSVDVLAWDRTASQPRVEQREGFFIYRIPIRAGYAAGILNLPNLLRWQVALVGWLFRHAHEYDILHACDFDTILPALWTGRLYGKRVVYDIFDFYADHLRRTPGWIKNWIRRRDLRAIDQADAVILCDDARREQIAGSHPRRLEVIYNSPEDERDFLPAFQPSPKGVLRLSYVGLMHVERMLLEMLDVLSRHPQWTLDMAGFGGDEPVILEKLRTLPNALWHGRVPYRKALELSQSADVLFALYDPAVINNRYSSPNKLFEAMMLGKPIVVAQGTNVDRIVEEWGMGIAIPYGDVDALDEALSRLAEDPDLRERMGKAARRAYETRFGWKVMEQRLMDLYRELNGA
ncbi:MULTISPECIES: glycosyltransferase family 4 protein [Anaerolinea]|uniref:Glycosyltransferase n=1 Tax=Anaerolinea thermophila (strain DSM 14523 / JCM 11388 / NBRC 100420 / UNI-1) TaxID=926569 RepID=E8N203_ANATU|nr:MULTISPECIES: glycosyltransferase family 4 protein [Anaerolinea]BAJ64950.1 putative glycosyltransferase [Anaerolinea thermophila UNI-1]